jgi:ATP-dependent helicase/nuclease subunit A
MSKREPLDAPARARIVTELDRSLIVEAGAGSGKTHEMAARMAAGIAGGVYEIERMAAVTFTRKAAAELRGRFQLALEHELALVTEGGRVFRPGNGDAAREARLRAALSNLERFFAGTIHSFGARLLRERPVEAGVSPGFTELDETEEMLLRQQSWRDYRTQARAAGHADYLAVLDAGIQPRQLQQAFNIVCNYEDVEFPPGTADKPDAKKAWRDVEEFWTQLRALLPARPDREHKCKTIERAERFAREWTLASRQRSDVAGLVELLEIWEGEPKVTLKWWDSRAQAKAGESLHEDFRATTVQPFLSAWRQYTYRITVSLLIAARDHARAERRRRNVLTFNDLLLVTADVLRTNEDVRRSLQQKYRWIFVDEFQDTDPVQAEIMRLLSETAVAGGLEPAGSGPSGTLFVVGDPKQSIYRFRRADIDIYNDVRTRLSGADGKGLVRLTTNFRSVPELCDWANGVFKTKFPAASTQHSPEFAPLNAYRETASGPALAVLTTPELGAAASGDEDTQAMRVATAEASRIAQYIRAEVESKLRTYGDFLILTRKRKGLRAYARALEALQVPIEVSGAGAFGESKEVRELALLAAALADPQDAVALVGVLRGPLFGASDRDLFAFRQVGGYFSIFSDAGSKGAGSSDPAEPTSVARALESLRRWHRWTRVLPAGAAFERILDDSGFLALAATTPGGVEAGDLLHAVDRVRALLESGLTLADASDALLAWTGLDDDGPGESAEVDSLPLQPGRPDVVRLMNLHKAKGLEAAVVFLADPLGGFESHVDVRIVRSAGAGAVGYFEILKDSKGYVRKALAEPEGWDAHEASEKEYLKAEADRLLYVAATRAKDLLVVGRYAGRPGRNAAWSGLDAHLTGVPELAIPAATSLPVPEAVDLSAKALKAATRAAEAAHGRAQRPSWAAVSVTAEAKAFPRITPGRSEDRAPDDDPTRVVSAETPSRRADAGIAWGTLAHGLLEHAMRHKTATREDLRRLAMWLTVEEPQLRSVIEQALDTVQGVAAAEFWQAARESAECHEEVPFSVRETREGLTTVMSGAIDLVYRDADGWRILDYKTDAGLDETELQKRYASQVAAYRRAWLHSAGGHVHAAVRSLR